nr:ERAP1-like C-terminal domain-containing protein [Sphingomonas melonis]
MGRVGEGADPLEWRLVSGRLGSLAGLYEGTPLETALRNRTVAILGPVLRRIGMTAQPGESPLVTNLRESLVYRLGAAGDGQVLAQARSYVAQLKTNPTAIPPAIRAPVLSTFATYATPADWDALLALTQAETNPVTKNRYVSLLGAAEDDAVATRALALLKTDTFTAPQKAALLRAISGSHPDMAFDWAVANHTLVDSFIEESSRSGFIVGLGGGSSDPKMPGKIESFAQTLPETSRAPARRVISGIAVRKAAAERLRPAVETWLKSGK